jgi:hypothetical protein
MINSQNLTINCITKSKITNPCRYLNFQVEREQHLKFALEKTSIEGQILEFGVFEGKTINIIADKFHNETVWGFDSFEGLPEDWVTTDSNELIFHKGYFKLEKLPDVRDNVRLVKGLFCDTIPDWMRNNNRPIKLLHIDCDLYSSLIIPLSYLCFIT